MLRNITLFGQKANANGSPKSTVNIIMTTVIISIITMLMIQNMHVITLLFAQNKIQFTVLSYQQYKPSGNPRVEKIRLTLYFAMS